MATTEPFIPVGNSITLSPTTAANGATLTAPQTAAKIVRVFNAGPDAVRLAFNTTSTAATANDIYIPVGVIEIFSKGLSSYVSAICPTSTATVYLSIGEGN